MQPLPLMRGRYFSEKFFSQILDSVSCRNLTFSHSSQSAYPNASQAVIGDSGLICCLVELDTHAQGSSAMSFVLVKCPPSLAELLTCMGPYPMAYLSQQSNAVTTTTTSVDTLNNAKPVQNHCRCLLAAAWYMGCLSCLEVTNVQNLHPLAINGHVSFGLKITCLCTLAGAALLTFLWQ